MKLTIMISYILLFTKLFCLTYYTSAKNICMLQIFEQDLRWTSTFTEACIMFIFMILLQKESLFLLFGTYLFITFRLNY